MLTDEQSAPINDQMQIRKCILIVFLFAAFKFFSEVSISFRRPYTRRLYVSEVVFF
jgi:hypothetical protein